MTLSYNSPLFFAAFLPAVALIYQCMPKKFRWIVLLSADYVFFYFWSKALLLYNIATTFLTYLFARKLSSMKKAPEGMDRKVFKKRKHALLVISVLLNLGVLVALKYTNFLGSTIFTLAGKSFTALTIAAPIGISYYTLQSISYLSDVANKKVEAETNFFKLALYTSFFPTILEGPITRFGDMAENLFAGHAITAQNLSEGYERIAWGLFKKMVIADHLAPVVTTIFRDHTDNGGLCLAGAIFCTLQLYMDFAGTIDIAIGAGKIFNITIAENFRQPFFAKNAGDFWHRWHITLGTFFRDYIFYPISLSKPIQNMTKKLNKKGHKHAARYTGPAIAMLFVWLANGFWHGPNWTYVFYGMYYFVFMIIEMYWEKPFEAWCEKHHMPVQGKVVKTFRFIKLFFIVIFGEMFFRASTMPLAWKMFQNIFVNFNMKGFISTLPYLGMDVWDYLTVTLALIVVIIVSVLKERKYPIRAEFEKMPTLARWGVLYALVFSIILFGAYGPGYDAVAMMYAGF
jgi:D-alanyl-lipoteichoic acid acyltransferase DltB (MBOAT superfamily)